MRPANSKLLSRGPVLYIFFKKTGKVRFVRTKKDKDLNWDIQLIFIIRTCIRVHPMSAHRQSVG